MPTAESAALQYHSLEPKGKIALQPTKPMATPNDLSLAYTPGVAEPVLAIADDPRKAYAYTSKGNLVAVVSNGTAILGLGNKGALASKPVMEGKAVLFKKFGNVDAVDIEVDEKVLTIRGKRAMPESIPANQYYLQECFWGEFARSITLPCVVDPKKVKATFNKDSILKILVPKEERVKVVRISEGG